jgi:outer membrane protein assembly factor BamB
MIACAVTFSDVPRDGINEVHEYLATSRRTPSILETLDAEPALAWTAEVGRGVTGVPAVGERVTAVVSVDRWVHALNTRTGELFWRFRGPDSFGPGPVMGSGAVYAATEAGEGVVLAIDLFSGRRRWQARTGPISAPLVLRDSTLYAVNEVGMLIALDTRTGDTRWSRLAGASRAGPLVADSVIAVASLNDSLLTFERTTGQPQSRAALPAGVIAPAAYIDEHTIALASPAGSVFVLTLPGGAVRWRVNTPDGVTGSPVVSGDTVFALTAGCQLLAIPVNAPDARRTLDLGCRTRTGPTLLRNGVLVATLDGRILFDSRTTTASRWTLAVGGELQHPPIVQRGQVIIAPVLGGVVSYR